MAIKFPKKAAAKAEEAKPLKKKVEKEEVEETEEEEDTEEEADDENEEEEDTEAEEEDTEEEEDEESEEDDEEEDDEEEEEEDEEEEKKPAKKAKIVKKDDKKVAKAKPVKTLKKGIKTGGLSSFGQKTTSAKESFTFDITIGEEEVKLDVPGVRPKENTGRLSRDQLIAMCSQCVKHATGNELAKKDVETLLNIFEGVLMEATEHWAVGFMGRVFQHKKIKERVYPPLMGKYYTFTPEHYEVRYRRVCDEENVATVRIKSDKNGPVKDKKGNFIVLKD